MHLRHKIGFPLPRASTRHLGRTFCLAAALSLGAQCGLSAALSPSETRLLQEVRAHQDEFGRDLAAAVRIDSATENLAGVRAAGEYFGGLLGELGFTTRWVGMPAEMRRAGHLFAERTGTRGKRLLLIGHLDTVLPGGDFREEGGRAFGSGVNDMKGGNLIVIHALRALHRIGALADTQIIVCITGDEESPGQDLAVARGDLIAAAKRSDFALIFEGTEANTVTAGRRGITFWELEVQSATGHSAGIFSALSGSGAVFETARILNGFYDQLRDEDGLTFNPGLIVGGTESRLAEAGGSALGKPNIIARDVKVRGDLRFMDPVQLARVKARMEAIVVDHLPRTSARLRFDDRYPAMTPTPASLALVAQLDQASRDLGYGEVVPCDPKRRGAGDASFVAPFVPSLDGLGPRGNGAHTANEDLELASIPEFIERTALLIYRLTR